MIQSLTLKSYKGFSDATIQFSDIACIIGENSTGKSTIVQAIRELLTTDNAISINECKAGINDNNTTSLSLKLQDGRTLSKNIREGKRGELDIIPQCITNIKPIGWCYPFVLTDNNINQDDTIKNQNITDIAWSNILSQCNFTLRTAITSTTTLSNASRFQKEHTADISEKFTNAFNNILESTIGRKYDFEIFFEGNQDQLVVQMHISYKNSDKESNKQSSWVDLKYESEGFRTLIALCSYIFNEQYNSQKVFVMDEPFTNIHPKAQREVSRMLEKLSQKFQIIYTTHCPHLLPERDKIICTLTEAAGDLSICTFEEYPLNRFYDLSPLALDIVEEIKQSDSTMNVVVEGPTDQKIYESLFELKGIRDEIHIISLEGNGNFKKYMEMLIGINKPSLFILDPNENLKNLTECESLIEKYTNLFLLKLPFHEENHIKKGIENLIPNKLIEKAYNERIGRIEKRTTELPNEEPIIEYIICGNNSKGQLAQFFIDEADSNDYDFFSPVIDKINEIM